MALEPDIGEEIIEKLKEILAWLKDKKVEYKKD